uniref:cystatin C (amyloid angiopathy and cerebral hemorrhage) n=1 Tax=Doryrhamphus excisus TaxID=161450 RepID=UPI0025AE1589|nr:cystatin C (amyloid angiopathy and cerebral hemorrhage) [Doryrhamphus excisus]
MFWRLLFLIPGAVCAAGLVGGFSDVDANNRNMQNALSFAIVEHNKATNDLYLNQMTELVRAQQQVVNGIKYRLTVKLAKTSCRKDNPEEHCAVFQDPPMANAYQCTFEVVSKIWLGEMTLTKTECSH